MYENDQKFQQWAQNEGYTQNSNGTWNENPYHNYLIGVNQAYPEDFQPIKAEAEPVKKVNGRTIYNPLYDKAKKKGKSALGTDWQSYDRQGAINKQHEAEDAAYAKEQGWDKTTSGSVTQGKKKNWLENAIDKVAGKIASRKEAKDEAYGLGNIDLRNRPMVQNEDGTYSTVDSVSFNIDGKEVLVPKVIFYGNKWTVVDDQTALQHYLDTGEYLGKFDTVEEANAYAQKLHEDQARLYNNQQQEAFSFPSRDVEAEQQRQKDQQYWLWQILHPNMTQEDYYRIFPNRAPK